MKSPSASSTAIPKGFCKENCTLYEYRDPYIIDFTGVKYYLQIHEIIKEALDFPDYYGKNWDAFWDCLTDMVGDPLHIEIYGLCPSPTLLPKQKQNTSQPAFILSK